MPRDLVLDTTTLSEIKNGNIDLAKAKEANVNYYVPVTQELEFLDGLDDLSEELRDSIPEVLEELDPKQVELESTPYNIVPYSHGPYNTVSVALSNVPDRIFTPR